MAIMSKLSGFESCKFAPLPDSDPPDAKQMLLADAEGNFDSNPNWDKM